MNLPNALTLLRMFLVPLLVVVLMTRVEGHVYLGAAIFGLAVLTDYLDGYFARRRNEEDAEPGHLLGHHEDLVMGGMAEANRDAALGDDAEDVAHHRPQPAVIADEVVPPWPRRALHLLVRLPLMVVTYILTQTTTGAVAQLEAKIAEAEFRVEWTHRNLLGDFETVAAVKEPTA